MVVVVVKELCVPPKPHSKFQSVTIDIDMLAALEDLDDRHVVPPWRQQRFEDSNPTPKSVPPDAEPTPQPVMYGRFIKVLKPTTKDKAAQKKATPVLKPTAKDMPKQKHVPPILKATPKEGPAWDIVTRIIL